MRVRPDAGVVVNWTITGDETGFRYGQVGDDVWLSLFLALDPRVMTQEVIFAKRALETSFWGKGKDYHTGHALQRQRQAYNSILTSKIRISNDKVLNEVEEIYERSIKDKQSIGVHRRVANWMVAACQSGGEVPSNADFIDRVSRIMQENHGICVIYLATDDSHAVDEFAAAFPGRLIVRSNIKRTLSNLDEVHCRDWGSLSLTDAADVLIDTMLLARCTFLVHASSSISTTASIINPELKLEHVNPHSGE